MTEMLLSRFISPGKKIDYKGSKMSRGALENIYIYIRALLGVYLTSRIGIRSFKKASNSMLVWQVCVGWVFASKSKGVMKSFFSSWYNNNFEYQQWGGWLLLFECLFWLKSWLRPLNIRGFIWPCPWGPGVVLCPCPWAWSPGPAPS